MIKITWKEEAGDSILSIEGKLCGPRVDELASSWSKIRESGVPAGLQVDLTGVTFISEPGRLLLTRMHAEGCRFIASGCATRQIVAEITGAAAKE